jgi:hypothetical protein
VAINAVAPTTENNNWSHHQYEESILVRSPPRFFPSDDDLPHGVGEVGEDVRIGQHLEARHGPPLPVGLEEEPDGLVVVPPRRDLIHPFDRLGTQYAVGNRRRRRRSSGRRRRHGGESAGIVVDGSLGELPTHRGRVAPRPFLLRGRPLEHPLGGMDPYQRRRRRRRRLLGTADPGLRRRTVPDLSGTTLVEAAPRELPQIVAGRVRLRRRCDDNY